MAQDDESTTVAESVVNLCSSIVERSRMRSLTDYAASLGNRNTRRLGPQLLRNCGFRERWPLFKQSTHARPLFYDRLFYAF